LEISGVGYRVKLNGEKLEMALDGIILFLLNLLRV
jgi:ribosomal protein L6P/L9E